MPTIGDELSAKGVSWAWYSGGWNNAVASNPDPLFQYHHQAFNFFKNYASGQARTDHLKDETDFMAAVQSGNVPAVSFIKPLGPDNEHPGYANITQGEQHAVDLINAVKASPIWNDTVIIVTYDEHGGSWDHVAPPTPATDGARADKWGPGIRVPTLVISPFAKQGFVDHTQYDTTSILKLIEKRFGVAALGSRDAAVNDLTNGLALGGSTSGGAIPGALPANGTGGNIGRTQTHEEYLLLVAGLLALSGGGALLLLRRPR